VKLSVNNKKSSRSDERNAGSARLIGVDRQKALGRPWRRHTPTEQGEHMTKRKMMLAASMAGLMAAGVAGLSADALAGADGEVHCYGVNKCKGSGDCGGKGHSCAGQNTCKGQGFVSMSEEACLQLDGGRLTEKK
jgi:uncharacterized membrane protein